MRIFLFFGIFLLAQCGATQKQSGQKSTEPWLSLQSGGCRGYCPVMLLEIGSNGLCQYTPTANCVINEKRTFQLTKGEIGTLRTKLSATSYRTYPERWESSIADAPLTTLIVHEKGKTYTTIGGMERPKPLIELEQAIRDIASEHGIDTRTGVDPRAIPNDRAGELIVQLKDDVNAGNWLPTIEAGNPKLVRRIPPNNTWLIQFDRTQITADDMLLVLRGSSAVIMAQRNMRADDRRD